MMDDILKQIKAGEVSGVQFKERILDKYDIACELVAFSNSHGGKLVVGIKDKTGETNALSYSEVQETTNLLSDIASENVVPSILIKIDTVEVEDGNLVIATVKEGLNKPYHDNKAGTSMPRNMFLFNNAIYLLPYTGVGSGITRALDEDINVTFMNNDKAQEFVITVWRGESNQVEVESNQVGNQVEGKSNQVEEKSNQVGNEVHDKSNQVEDHNTGLRHSDTNLDTGLRHSDTRLRHSNTNLDTQLRHSDTKKVSLSNKQRDIVNFCSVPRTTAEIMERLGLSNQTKNRERYITSLVTAGYLQMTNPDNPTASNQKYKKVNKR